jgi:hypothetical protein
MITILLLSVAAVCLIGALCEFSPEGYQTKDGFFYGKPPEGR